MNWVIVEDALRDKRGHWFEYIQTLRTGFSQLGDQVEILCDSTAESWLVETLAVKPVLPRSIWARMSDNAPRITRAARVPAHAWATYRVMSRDIRSRAASQPDVYFVPTVWVHHLLAWNLLVRRLLRNTSARVLLFFPNAPLLWSAATNTSVLDGSFTSRLMRRLLRSMSVDVRAGRVLLGVETHSMKEALERTIGLPFHYFPHPASAVSNTPRSHTSGPLIYGSYGAARHEKGSDILQNAISLHLRSSRDKRTHFIIQWVEDFEATRDRALERSGRVDYITRYFEPGEYAAQVNRTDIMVLPYRRSSYALRVSRVVIEAMTHGIPVIVTRGTSLAEQALEFGACVQCEDSDPVSLSRAIETAADSHQELRERAILRAPMAVAEFSASEFRRRLIPFLGDQRVRQH